MKFIIAGLFSLMLMSPAFGQEDVVRAEAGNRKAFVMAYLEGAVPLDLNKRKMAEAMVDIYIQSIIRTAEQTPLNDKSKAVYNDIKKNHFELLGNYLSEDEMKLYTDSLMKDAEDATICIYCDYPKKRDIGHCVFCGNKFE